MSGYNDSLLITFWKIPDENSNDIMSLIFALHYKSLLIVISVK